VTIALAVWRKPAIFRVSARLTKKAKFQIVAVVFNMIAVNLCYYAVNSGGKRIFAL